MFISKISWPHKSWFAQEHGIKRQIQIPPCAHSICTRAELNFSALLTAVSHFEKLQIGPFLFLILRILGVTGIETHDTEDEKHSVDVLLLCILGEPAVESI